MQQQGGLGGGVGAAVVPGIQAAVVAARIALDQHHREQGLGARPLGLDQDRPLHRVEGAVQGIARQAWGQRPGLVAWAGAVAVFGTEHRLAMGRALRRGHGVVGEQAGAGFHGQAQAAAAFRPAHADAGAAGGAHQGRAAQALQDQLGMGLAETHWRGRAAIRQHMRRRHLRLAARCRHQLQVEMGHRQRMAARPALAPQRRHQGGQLRAVAGAPTLLGRAAVAALGGGQFHLGAWAGGRPGRQVQGQAGQQQARRAGGVGRARQ